MALRNLNLDAIRSFIAICDTGSFRSAAARVHRSPSALSLQIANLEKMLGTTLLERDARNVRLTRSGEMLLSQARRIMGLNDNILATFKAAQIAGHLSLAAPHDLGIWLVPQLLKRIAEIHPNIQVDVKLGKTHDVFESFQSGKANVALFNDILPSEVFSNIQSRTLYLEPLIWVMLKGGSAGKREPLPLAVAELGCAWRQAALNALETASHDYHLAYTSDTSMGQVAAIKADLAIAALPRSITDRDLVEVPATYNLPKLPDTHICVADDGSDLTHIIVEIADEHLKSEPQRRRS